MSRRNKEPYNYPANNMAPLSTGVRSRRNLNARVEVTTFDDDSSSRRNERDNRRSSTHDSDYNIDDSESEEGPILNKNSHVFNPPINEKQGKIGMIAHQSRDGPFDVRLQSESKNQFDVSPINSRKESSRADGKRPSDLVEFSTPNSMGLSPIGYSSTEGRRRDRDSNLRVTGVKVDSDDDTDDIQVLDSDDFKRGRLNDASPHNRNARPRSSCIKKDWNRQSSDLSSPKQVRFVDETKSRVNPTKLDERLKQEAERQNQDVSPRFNRASARDDDDEFVKEISRQELENRYGGKDELISTDYKMGKRLRSNERLSSYEREKERMQSAHDTEVEKPRRVKQVNVQPASQNSYLNTGRTTPPPRNFQMRNIVSNTNPPRQSDTQNRVSNNNTIPEISSKYEESRDGHSSYHKSEQSFQSSHPRSRSPFNVSQNQNNSYVKENVEIARSPRRMGNSSGSQSNLYQNDDTNVLQQKSGFHNAQKRVSNSSSSFMSDSNSSINYARDSNARTTNARESNTGMRARTSVSPIGYREVSQYKPRNEPEQKVHIQESIHLGTDSRHLQPQKHSPRRMRPLAPVSDTHSSSFISNQRQDNRDMQRSPRTSPMGSQRHSPRNSPRHDPMGSPRHDPMGSPRHNQIDSTRHGQMGSPRTSPLGSPRRSPMGSPRRQARNRDSNTETNILSRFLMNKILNLKVEDMIFEIVEEGAYEATHPRSSRNVEAAPPIVKKQPSFNFEREDHQSKKQAIKKHNNELINVMSRIDDDEGNVSDDDGNDIDERSKVNPIIASMEKKETKNQYVKKRAADSLGIKFESNAKSKGVKSLPYHESSNYSMVNVRSNGKRTQHEV